MNFLKSAKRREWMAQLAYSVGGNLLYCVGFNLLIVPMGFYSGGFMGMSQPVSDGRAASADTAGGEYYRYYLFCD